MELFVPLLALNINGGWILNIMPVNKPIHKMNLINPIEVLRSKNDKITVNNGSVKMIVRASPNGRYCKQAKLK